MTAEEQLARLESVMRAYGPPITAFSGGVDSTVVAKVADRIFGSKALAVTGVSASLSAREHRHASAIAQTLGLRHETIDTHEMDRAGYRANAGDRCYHCKTELFERLLALAEREGFAGVVSGDNLDDTTGHRPGLVAATELGVRKPLVDAGLNKSAVRSIARLLGLPNHDKPAAPCLASRIPNGTEVDPSILARIEAAEAAVAELGFRVFRVRHHGEVARLEIATAEMERALEQREALNRGLKSAGYRFVALDLGGFRSGSLSVLPQ